ncbi:ankyrin repeat domain-containing protein [Paenibacillus hodogayensis]|uniref:Ankyrin repeat domain-containing protein n=1 Tax=Paenibacillus hodogayensis TaxID=279208 RepID=A0ABV5W1H0_9BACL
MNGHHRANKKPAEEQPEALRTEQPVPGSGGRGNDVWGLLVSSMTGDADRAERLLRSDPGLANCRWGYSAPLHFAVCEGHEQVASLLLEHGADATYRSPLSWQDDYVTVARDRGHEAIVRLLERHLESRYGTSSEGGRLAELIRARQTDLAVQMLDRSPELLHAADERGNTPLHWATLTRQLPLIDVLLERGADIRARRGDGATPLQLAIAGGDYWFRARRDLTERAIRNEWFLVGYLTARGADYDIGAAAAVGDTERLTLLLEADPQLANAGSPAGFRPLGFAAKYGHTAAVRLLLEHGADPNAPETDAPQGSALWHAAAGNHAGCAELLLERGALPDAAVEAGGTPLFIAISKGYDRLVRLLYAHGGSIGLDSACWLGRIDLAGEMIRADRTLVNGGGDYGPLCLAAGAGHADIVRLLIRSGADLQAPWYANNYMGYAADSGTEMVRLLLQAGADPNHANWQGVTYLHTAAYRGQTAVAALLLEFGADPDAIDQEHGTTPLGWAAKAGQTDMVRWLLEQGADPRLPAGEPRLTPSAWAERRGHADLAVMLRKAAQVHD